jgi:8-oxo-dGTP pyrophosphatase MutT (NUDIX family)
VKPTSHELPLVERNAVRLVVLDDRDRLLLLHTRDLGNPAFGTAWELPGGGMEPGESYADAAVRELREETGIDIGRDAVEPPAWRRDVSYTYRGARRLQHEIVVTVCLRRAAPAIAGVHGIEFEGDDHFEFKWWNAGEIAASSERFYPRSLPSLLPRFLAGETLDEPFESWP